MAVLDIKIYPDPILSQPTNEVSEFDGALHKFLDSMFETMVVAHGIGLAAPQVGSTQRVCVVDVTPGGSERLELINPKITKKNGSVPSEEGCLSIPDYRDTLKRYEEIQVQALDRHGKPFTLKADGLLAICIQHEVDHLDGVLFVDRLSRLKRELFKRWVKKHLAPPAAASR